MKIVAQNRELTMGIDAATSGLAITVLEGEEVLKTAKVPYNPQALASFLSRFVNCRIRSVYEAGSIGFWLHDVLMELGVDNTVTPPSKTPRAPGEHVKTDRRDSRKLADLHRAGQLKAVAVPPLAQRLARQLTRTRRQLVEHRGEVKMQIRSQLTFHHVEWPADAGKPWSLAWRAWLARLSFSELPMGQCLRASLDVLLAMEQCLKEQIAVLEQQIRALARSPEYRHKACVLESNSGVGPLSAMTILLETGSVARFQGSQQFTSFLGLTPTEQSSGQVQHKGHISKAGNTHIRRLLVEDAWVWIRKDKAAYATFRRIVKRREMGRAIVAMARRLATKLYWQLRAMESKATG